MRPLWISTPHGGTRTWRSSPAKCAFRGYDSPPIRAAELLALVERLRPERLIIDLRENGGGDFTLGLRYLIEPIARRSRLNRRGHLFVAIGTNTFSAAMANAAQFRTHTAAILVGQTIGEKPNSFQEARTMELPNSHLRVQYSTRYYRFVGRGPNAVHPDREIVPTWADYRAGRDPVLEWILQYGRFEGP
jgi:C-terminal processing protease CtpA/Prc